MGFDEKCNSSAKKIMRVLVYAEVAERLSQLQVVSSHTLIIPGPFPTQEIALAKTLLHAHVKAVDIDEKAVVAASAAGADIAVHGTLAESVAKKDRFDFANIDTCSTVAADWVGDAVSRVSAVSTLMATWFSYGREIEAKFFNKTIRELPPELKNLYPSVPLEVRDRISFIWNSALWAPGRVMAIGRDFALRPLKAWSYSHGLGGAKMFVVLWATDPKFNQRGPVSFMRVNSGMLQNQIEHFLASWGREETFRLFDCPSRQFAAIKAAQTLKRRKAARKAVKTAAK